MKQLPKGVRVNADSSLFLDFYYPPFNPPRCREVLSPNGIVLKSSASNIAYAAKYLQTVLAAIAAEKMGGPKFEYAKFFPQSKRLKPKERHTLQGETVEAFVRNWLEWARARRAHSTMTGYDAFGEEFIAKWGALHYTDLTWLMVKEWICAKQKKGLVVHTIKNMIAVLCGALDDAEELALSLGKAYINPVRRINWKKFGATEDEKFSSKYEVAPFELDEVDRLINAAQHSLKNLVILGFGLGMRINELFGLAWEDIDLKKLVMKIRYGRVLLQSTTLKNHSKSDRDIDLSEFPHVLAALHRQKELTFMLPPVDCGKHLGERHLVFYRPGINKPYGRSYDLTGVVWPSLLRKAGVVYRPPMQMRHTFATTHRSAGYPDTWIAKQLGHRTTRMLELNYGKIENVKWSEETRDELKSFWKKYSAG